MAFRARVRLFVTIPLLINIVLFGIGIFSAAHLFESLLALLPQSLDWLRFLVWPLFALASLAIVFFGFTIVANFIGAPFNGLLAEVVEQQLRGITDDTPFNWRQFTAEAIGALKSEIRKYVYFCAWAVPCLLLFLIPGVNSFAPLLWFVFGSWMLAIEYADYPMGNHAMLFPQVRATLRTRRRVSLGFGAAVLAMTMVPILNFLAMPVAVCGATIMWVEEFSD